MEMILILALVFGAYMAWNIGANDVANSMADAVGSKALTIMGAVILASIFEFLGAFLAGSEVTDTVRKGIIDPESFVNEPRTLAVGLLCALLAAALWLNCASYFGLPVSTTHSIVGAVAGFGLLYGGIAQVQWDTIAKIVSSWFISPIAGGVIAFIIFKLILRFILTTERPLRSAIIGVPICTFLTIAVVTMGTIFKGLKHLDIEITFPQALLVSGLFGVLGGIFAYLRVRPQWTDEAEHGTVEEQLTKVEKPFVMLVIISSCTVAFAHGANDVANAIGPLAGIWEIVKENAVPSKVPVPWWILCLGGAGIVVGLATYGYRVMTTIGTKITEITPSRGVAADIGATVTVLTCSQMGLPVSTTHTLVGAIVGVGMARGITSIDRRVIASIMFSWVTTLPIVAVLTMLFYLFFTKVGII